MFTLLLKLHTCLAIGSSCSTQRMAGINVIAGWGAVSPLTLFVDLFNLFIWTSNNGLGCADSTPISTTIPNPSFSLPSPASSVPHSDLAFLPLSLFTCRQEHLRLSTRYVSSSHLSMSASDGEEKVWMKAVHYWLELLPLESSHLHPVVSTSAWSQASSRLAQRLCAPNPTFVLPIHCPVNLSNQKDSEEKWLSNMLMLTSRCMPSPLCATANWRLSTQSVLFWHLALQCWLPHCPFDLQNNTCIASFWQLLCCSLC